MTREPTLIAMWSGPRNLSTALMRSFAQRADCVVSDEPFYAAYLARTGLPHPMRDEVIAAGITDPVAVAHKCLEPPSAPKRVSYQKHMTHHMLDGFDTGWIARVRNAFLIRSPERVLASYARKHETPAAREIGFDKQRELFERAAERLGYTPPVVEAEDIRADPEGMLTALCRALGLDFDRAMLSWAPGPRPEDGVWGKHWYDALWKSTGFSPPDPEPDALPEHLARIADEVREAYRALTAHKLKPESGHPPR